ncbi:hypothetical protein D3C72_1363100 [compost metagenome]
MWWWRRHQPVPRHDIDKLRAVERPAGAYDCSDITKIQSLVRNACASEHRVWVPICTLREAGSNPACNALSAPLVPRLRVPFCYKFLNSGSAWSARLAPLVQTPRASIRTICRCPRTLPVPCLFTDLPEQAKALHELISQQLLVRPQITFPSITAYSVGIRTKHRSIVHRIQIHSNTIQLQSACAAE